MNFRAAESKLSDHFKLPSNSKFNLVINSVYFTFGLHFGESWVVLWEREWSRRDQANFPDIQSLLDNLLEESVGSSKESAKGIC